MNEEIESLIRETRDLVEENNKILRGIRRSNRWGVFIKSVYWIVIVIVTIGAFAYIQPYLNSMMKLYNQLEDTNNKITTSQNSFSSGVKSFFGFNSTSTNPK